MKLMIRINEAEHEKILALKKRNKNKRVDKKLEVLVLRYEGKSNAEISMRTGYNERYITKLMGDYAKQGLEEFVRIKHTSHNWHISEAEEARILAEVEQRAEEGTVLTIADIEAVFREKIGDTFSRMYVYRVLKRHGWRKILPRSKHPKAASKEEQGASKNKI